MPFIHGRVTGVLLNSGDFTGYLNDVSSSGEIDATETTVFGNSNKQFIAGLAEGKISLGGLFDGGSGAADSLAATMRANAISNGTDVICTYGMEGLTDGKRCHFAEGVLTSYEVSSAVGDVNEAKYEITADGGVDSGLVLEGQQSVATGTTTNGTGYDHGASTSGGLVAVLHVTANANANSTTFKVQHSVDNTTYTDLATFTVVTTAALSFQRVLVAGTVNRWLRATAVTTGAGNITYTIAAARR